MELGALFLALALVFANGFFVAIEFALVKVRQTQLESLVEQGKSGAELALTMRKNLDIWLSASQVGITLASLALGWVGEPAFAGLIEPLLLRIAPSTQTAQAIAHTVGVVFAFGIITFLHIVVGEQVPKTVAITRAEGTALFLAWPMRVFYVLFYPVIALLNGGTKLVLKLLGLDGANAEHEEALSQDELRMIFTSSAEAGGLQKQQAELLQRALSMMEKTARQVLVPRSQMKALDLELTLEENLAAAYAAGHTWVPVIRGSLDRVEGLINVKDLFYLHGRHELKSLSQVQRPVLFVPENITLDQLLNEFKRRNKQIAVVVDEHGGTSGLITLADVVAELVGKVAELGRKVEPMQKLPGGKLELPGTAQLDDIEHTLEVEFDVDKSQVTTIAGFLMAKLGRVPVTGDVWMMDDYRVVTVSTEGPRVVTVRIEPRVVAPPAPSAPSLDPVK
ncbi:MAG: hemolysin family protein [Archangium sp.]|nr:hemolysin family protein [Archangium sp.]MDP3155347.1 hemolysin family protein [Archangium sp.]MDP3573679.1 hemolysin family protein [Archangium sp.]